ncbi:TetR/AcrR family transcriptional regulator [Undibacterium arcticum]|uniref:TetR/AcrR family transcriptional regulator n=1 Tax=Undibacterium arcticum TaxID=1762892 RepID=A0ABV7EXW3_9BURK
MAINQTRDDMVDSIISVFRSEGYEGASLAKLSEATGLGRSSLYHHFPMGKEDMANAALDRLGILMGGDILGPLAGPGSARQRLADFGAKISGFYADGRQPCLLDVFSVGDAARLFQDRLRQTNRAFIQAITDLAASTGASPAEAARRGEDALIAIEGALIVSRGLASSDPFRRVLAELPDRVLGTEK